MEIIYSPKEMQTRSEQMRMAGKTIAFVPTMGALHEGHLDLMREGKKRGDVLVVSIFVNPTQFGPGEDFEKYPRDLEADQEKVQRTGADIIFAPSPGDIYPPRFQTCVTVEKVTQNLCGLSRPTHFRGVTTVVAKLFNIVKPHVAIFGEKDYQQLVTIRQMIRDLGFDVEIIGQPTVREADGLAMSSRNAYLNAQERQSALCLVSSLNRAEELYRSGERRSQRLIEEAVNIIRREPSTQIDYVKICAADTLEDIETITGTAVMALAVKVGKTRLIDNRVFKNC